MVKIAILASGNGSNFENIVLFEKDRVEKGEKNFFEIKLLITDKDSYVIKRAEKLNIANCYVNPKLFLTKDDYEKKVVEILRKEKIDLVVLAGYMKIIGKKFLQAYENRIINIHPAYLPEFPGRSGIEDAFNSGVEKTGVTIHFVDEGIDTGKIIEQERIVIEKEWDIERLEEEVHKVEHKMYPLIIQKISEKIWRENETSIDKCF